MGPVWSHGLCVRVRSRGHGSCMGSRGHGLCVRVRSWVLHGVMGPVWSHRLCIRVRSWGHESCMGLTRDSSAVKCEQHDITLNPAVLGFPLWGVLGGTMHL